MFYFADGSRCWLMIIVLAVVCICICLIIMLSISTPMAILIQRALRSHDQCKGVGLSSIANVTQSGIYTIVGIFTEENLTCSESIANVNLKPHENRSNYYITMYLVNNNELEISLLHFNNTSNDSESHFNLGTINSNYRIFDDYFSQLIFCVRNYFLEANITLDIDVSSNFSTSELYVCSFFDKHTYYSKFDTSSNETFLNGANDCRSIILQGGERRNISEVFVADQPSFWYIGIAANVTDSVYVHRIWLRGVGHSISGITQNSAQPTTCTIPGTKQKNINRFGTTCILDLSVYKPVNQNMFNNIVLVAYEKDDPSNDYFTAVNVTLKRKDFSHTVRSYTIGVAVGDTILPILTVVVILTIIIVLWNYAWIISKLRNQMKYPTQVTDPAERVRGQESDRERQSTDTHLLIRSSSHIIDQRVHAGIKSNSEPESERKTSKTVEDYSADPLFMGGYEESINN